VRSGGRTTASGSKQAKYSSKFFELTKLFAVWQREIMERLASFHLTIERKGRDGDLNEA
jgi:hypothetical protein